MPSERQREFHLPRIRPTWSRLRGVEGAWELDGRTVRLAGDPETRILVAIDQDGTLLNPVEVISRGRHLGRE